VFIDVRPTKGNFNVSILVIFLIIDIIFIIFYHGGTYNKKTFARIYRFKQLPMATRFLPKGLKHKGFDGKGSKRRFSMQHFLSKGFDPFDTLA